MKKILIGVAALVVLVIVAALVIPFFVPTDTYKQQIAEQVKSATGRDLAIKGDIGFSLLPNIELKVNDVAFANAPGAASKDMATFKSLLVQLKLMPLLSGNVEVDSFVLVEPNINLEIDKSGKPNWEFQPAEAAKPAEIGKAPTAPAKPAGPPTDPMATLAKLKLGDIRLEKGRVTYADAKSGDKQALDNVNVTISFPDIQSALAVNGNLTWRGKVVSLKTKVDKPNQLILGKASPVSLNVDSEPVKLSFAGSLTNSQPPQAGGDLKLAVPSIRELARWTGNPIQMKGSGLGPLNVAGKLAMAGDKISFSGATLALDAIRGKGDFAVATGGKVPAITARLDVEKLDVNPYLGEPDSAAMNKETGKGGTPPTGGGAPAKPAQQGWSTDPIDVSALRTVNADLALSTGGIVYQKIQIGKSALKVTLNGGKLNANLTEMALYNGTGKASVAVDGSGAVPAINQSVELNNINSFPLLRDAADMKRLEGKANAKYAITGHGRNQKEIVQSLNGDGNVKFLNGAIRGVNIAAMVRNVSTAFLKQGFDEVAKDRLRRVGRHLHHQERPVRDQGSGHAGAAAAPQRGRDVRPAGPHHEVPHRAQAGRLAQGPGRRGRQDRPRGAGRGRGPVGRADLEARSPGRASGRAGRPFDEPEGAEEGARGHGQGADPGQGQHGGRCRRIEATQAGGRAEEVAARLEIRGTLSRSRRACRWRCQASRRRGPG